MEFSHQRGSVKVLNVDGTVSSTMVFKDPLPMWEGEAAWNVFTAADQFQAVTRKLGHLGATSTLCVFDGQFGKTITPAYPCAK